MNNKSPRFSNEEIVFFYKRNVSLSKLKNAKKSNLSLEDLKQLIKPRKTPTGRDERNYERSLRIILDYLLDVPREVSAERENLSVESVEESLRRYGLKFQKEEKDFINKLIDKKRDIKNSVKDTSNSSIDKISDDTGYSKDEVLKVINEEILDKIEINSTKIKEDEAVIKSEIFKDTSFLATNFNNAESSLRNTEFESEKNNEIMEASETRKLNKKIFEKENFDLSNLDEYELELLDKQIDKSEFTYKILDDYLYNFQKYLTRRESDLSVVLSTHLESDSDLSMYESEFILLKKVDFKDLLIKDFSSSLPIVGENADIRNRLIVDFKRGYYIEFNRKLKLKANFINANSDYIESDEGEESVYTNILKALDIIPQDSQLNLKNNLSGKSLSKIEDLKKSGGLYDSFVLEGSNLEIEELAVSDLNLINNDIEFKASEFYKNSLTNAIKDSGHFVLDAGNCILILNNNFDLPSYLIRGKDLVLLKKESGLPNVERLTIRFNNSHVYDSVLNNFSELSNTIGLNVDSSFLSLKGLDLICDINSEINVLPLLSETRSERTFLLFLRLALKYSAETYGIEDFSSDGYLTSKYLLPIDIIIMKAINEMYIRENVSLTELSSRFCISPYLASHVLNGSIEREEFRVTYFSNISSFMSAGGNTESR